MRLRRRAPHREADEPLIIPMDDPELLAAKRALSVAQGSLYDARDREIEVSRIAETLNDAYGYADAFGRSVAHAMALKGT